MKCNHDILLPPCSPSSQSKLHKDRIGSIWHGRTWLFEHLQRLKAVIATNLVFFLKLKTFPGCLSNMSCNMHWSTCLKDQELDHTFHTLFLVTWATMCLAWPSLTFVTITKHEWKLHSTLSQPFRPPSNQVWVAYHKLTVVCASSKLQCSSAHLLAFIW